MTNRKASFAVGQLVCHRLFGYRGVIIDVDPAFHGTEEAYKQVAMENPAREQPWYHLLVHGSIHHAYAAESQLIADSSGEAIEHPELDYFFDGFQNGAYTRQNPGN